MTVCFDVQGSSRTGFLVGGSADHQETAWCIAWEPGTIGPAPSSNACLSPPYPESLFQPLFPFFLREEDNRTEIVLVLQLDSGKSQHYIHHSPYRISEYVADDERIGI